MATFDLNKFGERVSAIRKERGMTQEQLSEKLGISTPHLSDIEHGKKKCSVSILAAIAEALNVPADWLLQINTSRTNEIYQLKIQEMIKTCTPEQCSLMLNVLNEMKEYFDNKE